MRVPISPASFKTFYCAPFWKVIAILGMWSGVQLWFWFVFLWSYGLKYNVLNGHSVGRRQWDKVLGLLNPRFLDSLLNLGKTSTPRNFGSLISNSESLLFGTKVRTHWKRFWHDTCPTPGKVSQTHSDLSPPGFETLKALSCFLAPCQPLVGSPCWRCWGWDARRRRVWLGTPQDSFGSHLEPVLLLSGTFVEFSEGVMRT